MGPLWLVPSIELAIAIPLAIAAPHRIKSEWYAIRRYAVFLLIGIANVANIVSLVALIRELLYDPKNLTGHDLLFSSIAIWVTNVVVFSLWFWMLDGGGPEERMIPDDEPPDFLWPQFVTPACARRDWHPIFIDYLYLAFTNATAFSPTDTMPLTPWAKTMMLVESLVSLLTIAIVASRAINILS